MNKTNLFFAITIIICLLHTNDLKAEKSKIPLCYLGHEVFDKDLVSYEDYIISKCFKTYQSFISSSTSLNKSEFLATIKKDKAFERFIFLYVKIKEYWHAETGTIVDLDYTLDFEDSIFKEYLIWGAQSGNYYAELIQLIEYQTNSVPQEILDSIQDNKYGLLISFDMGEETLIDNRALFFKKFSIDDFEYSYSKGRFLRERTEYEMSLQNKKDPEKYNLMFMDIPSELPEGFYSTIKLESLKHSALISLYVNNYSKGRHYINELFNFLSIDYKNFPEVVSDAKISKSYFDAYNYICDAMSFVFITDAYFEEDFNFDKRLDEMSNMYSSCFKNEESRWRVEGENIWWGLAASWYGNFEKAYTLLLPSKYPKHFGSEYAKSVDIMVPAFFNYAALATLEKGNLDQADEFLYHARDAYSKNELNNNFQQLLSGFINVKLVYSQGKYLQASMLLGELREYVLSEVDDLGNGYFIDEDIDIFINEFLDLTFKLKNINKDFFVDPLFLFEIKNLIFQSDNLSNLKKTNDEGEYNKLLEKYEYLRNEKTYIENQILESNNDQIYTLEKELDAIEIEIISVRSKILDLKKNLRVFYGISSSSYQDLQNRISKDDVILFYNFSISGGRKVILDKFDIRLTRSEVGRNTMRGLIAKLRGSIEIENGASIEEIKEFDFASSKKIYQILFSDFSLSEYENIFSFSNEVINSLPLQIIIKDYDEEQNGWSKYYSADWLNKNYNFAVIETLVHRKSNKEYKKRFVGLGDPDLSNSNLFSEIPNTKQELIDLALASGGKPNDLFMRENANYLNFKNIVQSKAERIVIASHAFAPFSVPNTMESGIVLSGINDLDFITASEIAQLNIDSDWVVLSACNTGFNQLNYSKNYSSLAKAFLAAGVDSVLISNWNIETKTSSLITKEIFNSVWLDENTSKHSALRIASEKLRNDFSEKFFAHPAFWGAFSVVYDSI